MARDLWFLTTCAAVALHAGVAGSNYNFNKCKETAMSESTITSKGQTTVPQPIREALHAEAGTRLQWTVMPDGAVIVRAKSKSVLELAGMLKAPKRGRVRVDGMNAWR